MKLPISTNVHRLQQKSTEIDANSPEAIELLLNLFHSLPAGQLGLAAPQIDTHRRVFIAWLPAMGAVYGFVNPSLEKSASTTDSTEGCLSLPNYVRTVMRSVEVKIKADKIVKFSKGHDGSALMDDVKNEMELHMLEAFVVQHENDHLNGILLIDLEEVKSWRDRAKDRELRVQKKRQEKAKTKSQPRNVGVKKTKSKKDIEKEKKQKRKERLKNTQKLQAQERYRASQEGLFNPAE